MKKQASFRRSFAVFFAAVFVLSAAAALLLTPGQSVSAANDTTGRGIGYTAELYNNLNGLPTSDVNAVVQTSEGFIWIGSYSGLIRYDGNTFYRYDSSTGISSVVSLYVDSKDRLWIGTNDQGVFVMKDGMFRAYGRDAGLTSLSIRALKEDAEGNILIATTSGIAYIDPEDEMHVLDDPRINGEYICEFETGADGLIYALSNAGDLFTIDHLSIPSFYKGGTLVTGLINCIYPDPDQPGFLYLGMEDSTIYYGDLSAGMAGASVYSAAPQKNIACVKEIDGDLWLCADNGIGYLHGDTYVPLADLPMTNSVEHIFRDHENNLWFTSSRQGLMKIVNNRFIDIFQHASLPPLVVNSTWMKDGLVYLGTDTGLYIVDEDYEQVENDLAKMLADVRIRSIREGSDGRLWFGTNSDYALLAYDTASGAWESFNTEKGLVSNRARVSIELSDGRIAVATNAGVNLIENGAVTGLYAAEHGLNNLEILCLEEGSHGEIYAGSDGDGIYVIDGDNVSRIGIEEGLQSDVILRICKDPEEENLFWIVTSNSLAYIRDGKIHNIEHFPYSNNFDIKFDGNGHMWILSSIGIYIVKRDHMLADEKIAYTLYDIESGLPSVPTANSYSCQTAEGDLYIAATDGASEINMITDMETNADVRLSVPFVMVDDDLVYIKDNKITIPSDCKKLTVYAYAFNYSLNNPHIRYELEGFDSHTTEVMKDELDPIVYTNLPGGTYRFHLAKVNTISEKEDTVLDVTIEKQKRLSEQIWFWVLVVALAIFLVVLLLVLYFRRKTKKLNQKAKEHRMLINEMASVFARVIDKKDAYTNGHSQRVAQYSVMLAKQLGKDEEELDKIYHIALLHDIGKIGIPDEILNKPGRLTDDEFAVMKTHSPQGYEILKEISIEPELAIGAGYHHERLDGRGYPNGLTAEEIPEIAQIIAVADTFDAMFSTRPYRKKMEISEIEAEVKRVSGTQLNPDIVNALVELIHSGAFDNVARDVE